jgi:hypothetical protein
MPYGIPSEWPFDFSFEPVFGLFDPISSPSEGPNADLRQTTACITQTVRDR